MDKTETYRKMADTPEIQAQCSYKCKVESVNMPWWDTNGDCWFNVNNERNIWLPRQDQLQEMVKYYHNRPPAEYSARGLLGVFWQFVDENWGDYLWTMSDEQVSMEQLWLAFVMKEKFNKVWDGEKWVNADL